MLHVINLLIDDVDKLSIKLFFVLVKSGLQFMPTKEMIEYAYNCASNAASQLVDTTNENSTSFSNTNNASSLVNDFRLIYFAISFITENDFSQISLLL